MADTIYGYFGANSGITWGYEVDNRTGIVFVPGDDDPF